jgi:hypothetical protein
MSSPRPDLTGLDDVRWASIQGPYGPAVDVAARIRALARDDERGNENELGELWQDLNHQGTVYETAAPAVPFLIEIATTPEHARSLHVLLLIGSIAHGSSGPPHSPVGAAERAKEVIDAHGRALLEAAEDEGWPFLVGLAYVVDAATRELAPRVRELVRGALETEEDPVGRGALSIAAYLMGDPDTRLLEDARAIAVREDALADHVECLDAFIEGHEPPEHTPALAEYLFDAAGIAAG